jgi:putative endonuclease
MHYVYVLQSLDRSEFYIGCTSDLRRRLAEHQRGEGRSTCHQQWRLVYYEAYLTLGAARKRETGLKQDGRVRRFLMDRVKAFLD